MAKKAAPVNDLPSGVQPEDASVSAGSSKDSLNTEQPPVPPQTEQAPPCGLCLWLERRINNTVKEQIKHMEKYHIT